MPPASLVTRILPSLGAADAGERGDFLPNGFHIRETKGFDFTSAPGGFDKMKMIKGHSKRFLLMGVCADREITKPCDEKMILDERSPKMRRASN